MTGSRSLLAVLILSAVLLSQLTEATQLGNTVSPSPQPQRIDCGAACKVRCKQSSRPNLCVRACGTCCLRCKCMPAGTSGNYETCPCYFNMKTHGNIRKCP